MQDERPQATQSSKLDLKQLVAAKRIAIVHYGDRVPFEAGYRPGRMGQLATWLTEAGADVTRFSPSYSTMTGDQRPLTWSGQESAEGTTQIIWARSYGNSRRFARLGHLYDFELGVGQKFKQMDPFSLIIAGVPPPGMVWRLRRSQGGTTPILADIRDLWPDAIIPSGRPILNKAATLLGRGLALELGLADGVVAMSPIMLERAPGKRRLDSIPLSIPDEICQRPSSPQPEGPMRAVFVGSFTQGVDFRVLLDGWRKFQQRRSNDGTIPQLTIVGDGERRDLVKEYESTPGIVLVGRVEPKQVAELLDACDIGLAPTRPGFGTTLSNKVVEYLGLGLFVANSLEPRIGDGLASDGFGMRVEATSEGWSDAFMNVQDMLKPLRDQRNVRRESAIAHYGREAIESCWLAAISQVFGDTTADVVAH